jgi:protein involved in polysaccharide export with SLBB domain
VSSLCAAVIGCLGLAGCATTDFPRALPEIAQSSIPRELQKVTIPPYRVEPPDILLIAAVNNIRPPQDRLRAGDQLGIRASNVFPIDPMGDPAANDFKTISGIYRVQTDGTVDLGPEYGSVKVEELSLDQARGAINQHLRDVVGLAAPKVAVSMPDVAGKQVISGEHLVRPDGRVALGVYGSVYVAGLTLDEVKQTVEAHLAKYIHRPEVQVDVLAYNSKVYYVITDGGGFGERIARLPFTGNETVLDAISQIDGLSSVSSKRIWVARPGPADLDCAQTMPVDWCAVTRDAATATNYQILPGDRIYIKADSMIAFDNVVQKVITPWERIFGFILLGNGTVRTLQQGSNSGVGVGFF